MRSKEEILGKAYEGGFDVNSGWMFDGSVKEVFDAMDEYAKEFASEILSNWIYATGGANNEEAAATVAAKYVSLHL